MAVDEFGTGGAGAGAFQTASGRPDTDSSLAFLFYNLTSFPDLK